MRNYMIFLGLVALVGFAAGAAQAQTYGLGTRNDLPTVRSTPSTPSYGGARPVQGERGRTVLSVDPLSYPSAHSEMLSRENQNKDLRAKYAGRNQVTRVVRGKPSGAYPIPSSDGYRVSNPLGSVYCGINGCWR